MKHNHEESRIQAEIAGAPLAELNEPPRKRQCLRDFALRSVQGGTIRFSDYRGKSSVVLILSDGGSEAESLVAAVANRYQEVKRLSADVLAIVEAEDTEQLLPFPVLVDTDRRVLGQLGAVDVRGKSAAAVYIVDQYGEVFAVYRSAEGERLPNISEILRHLEFISFQCPECEPPEWPA